ncbi:SigE family RNA polymerase sigma factor [Stackebrandtia nassauensis]|uniref:RNA polymerase, sigma-24 subunit, ECF subfamily n=1 Tax=Stackebrandtia nassauensis (strain DSM 44728 / CIP 108903 / NRRL B-16338 / NBRC 102104 / LLR-40K-21) TaxID=446470 RepID=D3QAD5_STANL|nr:SigE family RNA polymerase sigma factor [Stackebrandtia nassauensis]ADD42718.1 RNA polymerase, sigma-24 subunit, ECF subfamily [Stackebrandtia nassauensis DSM 44728]
MKPEAEAEYREFVSARLDQLGRFAFLLCRDWHRAEDAVQKGLVKLYLHWDKTTIKSPDAYVRQVIVNVVREEARRHWFKRERSSDRLPERHHPDPGEAGSERLTMLDALSRLPKRQRIAVVLRIWEDLSVEQTAEIMACSPGTVKSQTARGLQTLRGLLSETIPEEVTT